jgi:hypothetical protein
MVNFWVEFGSNQNEQSTDTAGKLRCVLNYGRDYPQASEQACHCLNVVLRNESGESSHGVVSSSGVSKRPLYPSSLPRSKLKCR